MNEQRETATWTTFIVTLQFRYGTYGSEFSSYLDLRLCFCELFDAPVCSRHAGCIQTYQIGAVATFREAIG